MKAQKQKSSHAAAASAIKQELKALGIKASVKSESYSMGNSVHVKVNDLDALTLKQVETICNKYQYGHFDGMTDCYEYSNNRDDIPQSKYVSVSCDYSEELRARAWSFMRLYYSALKDAPANHEKDYWVEDMRAYSSTLIYRELHNHSDFWRFNGNHGEYVSAWHKRQKLEKSVREEIKSLGLEVEIYFDNESYDWHIFSSNDRYNSNIKITNTEATKESILIAAAEADKTGKAYKAEIQALELKRSKTIEPISVSYKEFELFVNFPSCNKNDWMSDNDQEIERKANKEKSIVKKTIVLTDSDYQLISESLLTDRPDLWEKIGGNEIDDEFLEGIETGSDEYYQAWRENGKTHVIKVINETTNECFFVDTSGYDYARYVGRQSIEIEPVKIQPEPTKPIESYKPLTNSLVEAEQLEASTISEQLAQIETMKRTIVESYKELQEFALNVAAMEQKLLKSNRQAKIIDFSAIKASIH